MYDYIIENGVAKSKDDAIDRLCSSLYERGRVTDLKAFKAAVYKRESEMSTELAPGVFVPHAKDSSVRIPSVAKMKTAKGESVFLIASNSPDGHIKALSELAKKLSLD